VQYRRSAEIAGRVQDRLRQRRLKALNGWKRKFDEPIELPDGRKLRTLQEAIAWLAKEIPKSEHTTPKVQAAARMVTEAAENGGPIIFARMGVMQAINRHEVKRARHLEQATSLGEAKAQAGRIGPTQITLRVLYRRAGIPTQMVVPSVS
jgi:hypothetical protein